MNHLQLIEFALHFAPDDDHTRLLPLWQIERNLKDPDRITISGGASWSIELLQVAIKQSQNLSWRSSLESIISELSHSVKDLLRRNIASVHQLEVLLLLKRTPERGWLPDEIGLQLYTNVSAVLKELEQLHVLGFVETSEQGNKRWYRYCAQTPELDEAVNEVAEAYRSYRFRVIDAIFSRPHDIS